MNLRLDGETMIWAFSMDAKGKKYQIRQTQSFSSDGRSIQEKSEYSEDGVNWKAYATGIAKRV
jgi:hypothetical protein